MSNNPITFITGTSKGIGRKLAEYYANKNHIVIGCSRNNIDFEHENYTHFQAAVQPLTRNYFAFGALTLLS